MARAAPLAIVVFLLAVAPAASATNRYAAPTSRGTGSCLSAANACDLATAVDGAGSGDQVFVRGDLAAFNLGTSNLGYFNPNAIHVHGTGGRPQLNFTTGFFTLHAGSSLDNVSIASARNGVALNLAGASADRVVVRSSGPSGACGAADATLTNSVCASSTPLSGATVGVLTGDGHDILRNDTFYSTASGSQPGIRIRGLGDVGAPATADIVNVIARGEKSGGAGIEAYSDGSEDSTVNISYSNASAVASPSAPAREHVNTDATDQSPNPALPLFIDPSHGNFREMPGAPTIDHGVNSPANGTHDLAGNPRTVHGRTDIGAFEFIPDTFKGVVIVTTKTPVNKGHVTIKVRCPGNAAGPLAGGPGSCKGKLTLRTAKKVNTSGLTASKKKKLTLGSSTFSLRAGITGGIRIDISKKGLALLKQRTTLKTVATAVAHDGRGKVRTTTGKVKLELGK